MKMRLSTSTFLIGTCAWALLSITAATAQTNATTNETDAGASNSTSSKDDPTEETDLGSLKWVIFGVVAGVVGIPLMCLCLYFVQRNHAQKKKMLEVQEMRQNNQSERTHHASQKPDHGAAVFDFNYTPSTQPLPQRATFVGQQLEEFDENVLKPPSASSGLGSTSSTGSGMRRKQFMSPNGSISGSGKMGAGRMMNGRIPLANRRSPQGNGGRPPLAGDGNDDELDDFALDVDEEPGTAPKNAMVTPSGVSAVSASEISVRNNSRESEN